MNYDQVINAAYEWISLEKAMWFLLFFWLSLPVLMMVPYALADELFYFEFNWIVHGLYYIIYLSILLGFMLLTCACLNHKKLSSSKVSISKYIDTIFLVFVELWYVLVWNMHKSYRFTQLLLLIGIPILAYYYSVISSVLIGVALLIFGVAYLIMVIYNAIRCSFSITIFYNKNVSLEEAVKESWHLTHRKFWKILFSYIFAIVSALVLFVIISAILAAILNLFLINYLTLAVSYKTALWLAAILALGPALISYYFGFIEIYSQLNTHHESDKRVKRVLANRLMTPVAKPIVVRKFAAKKVNKKKAVKKKTTKKKSKKRK